MTTDPIDKTPPHDIQAEIYTLACCLDSPGILAEVAEMILPSDFYRPAHGDLFKQMILIWAAGDPLTLVTLRDAVLADPDVAKGAAGLIPNLVGLPVAGVMGPAHARIVWKHSIRRRLIEVGTRTVQLGYEPDGDPAETLARAQAELTTVAREVVVDDAGRLMNSDQFLGLDTTRTTPVIPGLLWHEERVIIVGVEGDGKTTLGMQVGYAAAAGVHPFVPATQITPMHVMLIDLENPRHELQERVEFFTRLVKGLPGWNNRNLTILSRPAGVDLSSAHDRFYLAEKIRQVGPDLIVGGPLYKMIVEKDGGGSEATHSAVTRFWDLVRDRHGCALWFETHPPLHMVGKNRIMRPLGSGIYSRWPEFGINLMPGTAKQNQERPGIRILEGYRGHRNRKRVWPESIYPNRLPGLQWPWEALWPQGTFVDGP